MSTTVEIRYQKSGYQQTATFPHVPGKPLRMYLRQLGLIGQRLSSRMVDVVTRKPLRMAHIPGPGDIIELTNPNG